MPDNNPDSSIRENKHLPALDGLRGFAVLFVIFGHYWPETNHYTTGFPFNIFHGLTSFGYSGVDLFFVLSGFLITGILIRTKEKKSYFRNFYIRRVLRIFPLYYFILIIFLLLVPHNYLWMTDGNRYPYWLFLMNFKWLHPALHPFLAVTWSLAIEEQYYLVMPTVVYLLDKKRLLMLLIAVFLFSFLLRTILLSSSLIDGQSLYALTFVRLDGLAIGGIIRLLFEFEGLYIKTKALFVKALPFLVVANAVIIIFCIAHPEGNGRLPYHPFMITVGIASTSVMYASLLLYCLYKNNFLTGFFKISFMRMTGKYSYAMYLLHNVGLWMANNILLKAFVFTNMVLFKHHLPLVIAAIVFTYALAMLSWKFLENPCLRLKRKFA